MLNIINLPNLPTTAEGWQHSVQSATARCDLDVLLKDEWRHKVAVRDDWHVTGPIKEQLLVIDGESYAALQGFLHSNKRISLGALVLTALHSVLDAYGHGSQTVVAFVDATSSGSFQDSNLLPTLVDHAAQLDDPCSTAIETMEQWLCQKEAYVAPHDLLHLGLFDAVLLLVDGNHPPQDMPRLPLAAVIAHHQAEGRLIWKLSYAGELFEDRVIAGVLDVARALLDDFVQQPAQLIGSLELVSAAQRRQLDDWNATDGEFDTEKRLEGLFEDAVRRTPEHEALIFKNVRLTYRALNEQCNRLAHWLLEPEVRVQPQELIALYLDKSELVVVSMIGIWKAGAAYVPIDPNYPADRVRMMVRDTGATRIVANRHYAARLREMLAELQSSVQIIELETVLDATTALSVENPELNLSSAQHSYVMYTSGTTGVPKGVAKQHRNVVNSITDLSERYGMRGAPGQQRVALFAAYVFEPFMRQMLLALINSHVLVIVPDEIRLDPHRLPAFVAHHGVTYLNGTGSVLQHFDLRACPGLKKLVLIGEELTAAGLRQLRERFDGHIINEYSFTEAAFVTAIKEFAPGVVERPDRSIGRPVRNVKWYVLSNNLKLLPIGAIGELYIGGIGIARGYLNRPDLTAERFLVNPFQTEQEKLRGENERIYKTGDLARMLPNGEVEFMGRSDFQLKINGVRIEPGEIEARATEFPGVRKCVVVARDGAGGTADRHLVGYFVPEPTIDIAEADLLAFLEERLIRVMVPARMVRLDSIPVNVNGKVDWRALPDVSPHGSATNGHSADSAAEPESPANALVDNLRDIWSEVLGVPTASIDPRDNFFRLGGQSISCILLIARVRQRLRLSLSVEDVFKLRTLGSLAEHLAKQTADELEPVAVDGVQAGGSIKLLANGLQQGLMYHALKSEPGDDAYIMQSVYRYRCAIRPDLMAQAWWHAQAKYPSLRLRFEWAEEAYQIIDTDPKPLDWRFIDLSGVADIKAQEARIEELQRRDRSELYALDAGQLFRVYLIKQRDDLYALLFSCHHIILDGWSLPILHDDVHRTYLRLIADGTGEPVTDTAYIAAQRYWEQHRGDHVDYWTKQLERIGERGDLAGLLNERSRYKVALRSYDHVLEHRTSKLHLGAELTAALKAACTANQLTLHSVLQFVWHKVLYAIGGGSTTVVGTITSGRNLPIDGIEDSVGLFINTLPIIVDHDQQATKSVVDAIADIQQAANAMNSRSTVELGRLESGEMKRQLFDTLLVLENYPRLLDEAEAKIHHEQLRFERAYDADKVDHPLAVVAREEGDELVVNLWYAGELFDDNAIDTLLDTTHTLFVQVAEHMSQPVGNLEFVSDRTLAQFDAWNDTSEAFPEEKTLHAIFEEAAERWPDEIALIFRTTKLTYRELNAQANRLAHYLRSRADLHPNDLIGLVLDKSERMMLAIIAVWKAGVGYVPIDPSYPDERIAFMLDDTAARLVLTNTPYVDRLRQLPDQQHARPVLAIERLPLDDQPAHNPVTPTTSTDLAYAIYTSGTTGRPKAVLLEHRGVVNLQISLAKLFSLSRADGDEAFLSFSNYVFDHFVEQMTDALLNGQTLVVLDDELRTDNPRLYQYMNDNQVTYLSGTPSVLSLYDFSSVTSLTRIDAIGEDFTEPVFNAIRKAFKGTIINGYGPTEISITSHKRPYSEHEPRVNKSIGFPVANTACYVLNPAMKLVPVGGIGELYIGGIGVARGYLNRDDLTNERFLPNPFQSPAEQQLGTNARIYKTGDLVRWLPNGELEYLGRNDLQVKIRGQRVELGEIETVLTSYPGVSRSFVIAREHRGDGGSAAQKYLVGFYLSDHAIAEQDIVQWMKTKLPLAVVPVRILQLDEVPVTASGKLDTRRLPETDFVAEGGGDYTAPAGEIEIELCGIWSKVLGIAPDRIGVRDDFFAMGGDSLRAIKLVQAVTSHFGRVLDVAAVFKYTTIADQAEHIKTSAVAQQDESTSAVGLAALQAGDPPVSLAQERLLFIDEFTGGSAAYNVPFVVEMTTSVVTRDAITHGLRTLLRRHAALRTLLRGERDGLRLQHVLDADEALTMFHVVERTAATRAELDTLLVAEADYVFRLDAELPIRVGLFALADRPDTVYLSIVVHHTCFDGWSWNIYRRELAALGSGVPEAELARSQASYTDFAVWQRQRLTGDRLALLTDFWTNALAGFEPINLPLDRPRPAQFDYRGREVFFDLEPEIVDQLKALAKTARVSFFSVLLGAYSLMLKTYTGQHDIIIGTPAANRSRPEFAGVIGFFVNLLVLRTKVDGELTLLNYLRSVGETVVQAQVHQELPFEQLVKELRVEKDPSRHPVVQAVFNLLNEDIANTSAINEHLPLNTYLPDNDGWTTAKFDLSLTMSEVGGSLTGNFTYAASLFEAESINHFVASFKHILKEFVLLQATAATVLLSDVQYLDERARAETLATAASFTPQPLSHSNDQTLHHLFEQMAERWPNEVAVVCGTTKLTYRELNAQANRLAHYLRSRADLHPNDLIGLVLDKSERMIVAIIAVWKAGVGYVPIDPSYPDERIAFMLDDTAARLVLTNTPYADRLRQLPDQQHARPVLAIERLPLDDQPAHNPVTPTTSANLAYAIYTSGTTGQPKAVLIRHGNVASFHSGLARRYFGEDRRSRQAVLFLANYVFDFSIEQMALSILSGHTLIVPPTLPIFDDEFYDYLNRHRLTYISGTPTYVQQFDLSRLKHVQLVLVAGEAFQPHHFDKMRREYSGLLLNAYGTTETSVYNTVRRFEPDEEYRNALGAPLSNTRLYVLGSDLQLLPIGAVGELFIAGDCVGVGYLNRPELTHERFIANPFQTEEERRAGQYAVMYKTGDVVRRRVDNEIEFLGRNDTQVKINGLRVELGEVEAAIAAYPGVLQCAVVPQDDTRLPGSKRLVGYYVVDDAATIDEDQIIAFLRAQLMPTMVPAMLVRVDGSLPMTINGKLDTEALPRVDFSAERSGYVAPRSRLESRLCQIWSKLLPGGAIGVDDDFFRSGGDSITALQLVSEMQRELKQKLSVKLIFDYPTVRSFVENAIGSTPEERSAGEQGPLTGSCPMLPIQEWFFAKPLIAPSHWNQYFAIRTSALDDDRLRDTLDRLFDHHAAFRLRFRPSDNAGKTVEQFYSDDRPQVTLHTLDVQGLSATEIEQQLEVWQSGFDLERGPLHCVAYLHGFADGSARVWIAMHHLIVDTVSWRILAQDLEILYNGGDLGLRGSSYRQWAQALRSYTPAPGEVQLWAEVAAGVKAEANRARATHRNTTPSYHERFTLGQQETQALLVHSNRAYDTQINDLLLTAVGFALRAVTQQTTNYVMVESHGREDFAGAPDVRDTVGWFTTMHPLAIEVCEDLGRSIEATRASRRRVPHNGIGYGAIRGVYGSAEAPIPATSFNYLGRFDEGTAAEQPLAPHEVASWRLDTALSGVSRTPDDRNTSDCAIDVTMSAIGGQMVVEIDSRLAQADTQQFSAELKSRLEAIIAHTSAVATNIQARTQRFTTREAPRADDFDPYILVNENDAAPVLFVLPPGEGGAESYLNNLAKQMPGMRLVLFNNVHLHRPMHSFEEIAEYYLTYVRQIQPAGPYNFLGWSFGGVLSLEMALQLTRAGERVENLILIDSLFNVKKAAAAIQLREIETVIDPINERYTPAETDLERLRAHTGNILLFKATKLDATFKGENQREFFEYYAQSPYNNLETLIPAESLSVASLGEDTHFSWVYNTSLVASISSRIRALVMGSR